MRFSAANVLQNWVEKCNGKVHYKLFQKIDIDNQKVIIHDYNFFLLKQCYIQRKSLSFSTI